MDFLKMHFNALFDRFDLDHLKSVSKRLFIFSLVLFILLSFFVVNSIKAHAYSVTVSDFSGQPFVSDARRFNEDSVFYSYVTSNGSTERFSVSFFESSSTAASSIPGYIFAAPSPNSSSQQVLYFCSEYQGYFSIYKSNSSLQTSGNLSLSSSGFFYTWNLILGDTTTISVPSFSSVESGFSALRDYVDGVVPSVNSFTVPAGYVAYAQLSEPMQTVDLSTTMPVSSSLLPSNGTYWVSNQYVYDGLSLPVSGTTFPLSGRGSVISWNRGEPRNIFGVTKNAVWSFPPVRNLIAIYNPFNYLERASQGTVQTYQNGDIHVSSTSSFLSVSLYPLADNIVWSSSGVPSVESISQDDYSSPLTGDLDENGSVVGWLDSDGSPVIPPIGGGVNDVVNGISTTDIFSDFFARVESLLQNGVEAVRRLLSLSSSFFSVISSLWTWLPPEVYNVITSAVILVIVVGFFKAFL